LIFGSCFEDGGFNGLGGFIVHDIQLRFQAVLCEFGVEDGVGSKGFLVTAIFHGLNENRIAVVII
jgi:hypothetical protein